MTYSRDTAVRMVAFQWLADWTHKAPDAIPRRDLEAGFKYEQTRVPLVGPQGIFKPRIMDLPLSITTVLDGPYDDQIQDSGLIEYRYRGKDPQHRDNVGLREAMRRGVPLVYLVGVGHGRYQPVWPVLIVGDSPAQLTFSVAVEDMSALRRLADPVYVDTRTVARREYVTAAAKRRLHQRAFREQVLAAYRDRCAVCRLNHRELLDCAHILEDSDGGPASLPNGLALCKLHHAAFDSYVIGINPERLTVEVRRDVLEEVDGPMLVHGLQALHSRPIDVPRREIDRPARSFLAPRYEKFRAA